MNAIVKPPLPVRSVYETFEVKPLTIRIGAEIHGIDLAGPFSDQQTEELKRALAEYQVIFFRDQVNLDHESHKAFGRLFGDLAIHSGVPGIPGHKEIVAIHADENSTFVAAKAGTPTSPPTPNRRSAPSSTCRSCRRWAATPCSPACTRPTTPCRTR